MGDAKRRRTLGLGSDIAAPPPESLLPPAVSAALAHARRAAAAAKARYSYAGAAWHADKALSLSGGAPQDAYTLAEAHMMSGEFSRALRTLERHGLLDAARHAAAPPTACGGAGGGGATPAAPGKPQEAAARSLGFDVASPGAPSPSPPASSPAAAAPPPQATSAVRGDMLRYVYLGAQCLRGLRSWGKCLELLEGAMEGRGLPALRTPLGGVPAAVSAAVCAAVAHAAGGAPPQGAPSWGGGGGGAPGGAGAPSLGAGAAPPPADRAPAPSPFLAAPLPRLAPPATPGPPPGGDDEGVSAASCGGGAVWRVVHAMALQHCDTALGVEAAGGGALGGGAGEPCALRGVPLASAAAGEAVPLGDGSRLNIVSALANLRGEVLLACDSRARAAQWFLAALRVDPHNVRGRGSETRWPARAR